MTTRSALDAGTPSDITASHRSVAMTSGNRRRLASFSTAYPHIPLLGPLAAVKALCLETARDTSKSSPRRTGAFSSHDEGLSSHRVTHPHDNDNEGTAMIGAMVVTVLVCLALDDLLVIMNTWYPSM
jgi:hypothetical protein